MVSFQGGYRFKTPIPQDLATLRKRPLSLHHATRPRRPCNATTRTRTRVGCQLGMSDWVGFDVPEPAGRGLLGMGDDLAAPEGRAPRRACTRRWL
eukprot:scaffold32261_cov61-Phaeocystis_antarctica.AAC.1